MALTSVVFAFHDQFYDAQDAVQRIGAEQVAEREQVQGPPNSGEVLPPAELARRIGRQLPGFTLHSISYETNRSEEHTSELQSLMRISYAVFCLKKKKTHKQTQSHTT